MQDWILKFPVVDSVDVILLKVSQKNGGGQLDLDLVATDGDAAFRCKVRERKIDQLKQASYSQSSDQWRAEVLAILVPHAPSSLSQTQRDSLRASCKFSRKTKRSSLTISILEDVSGIRHTHGAMNLEESEVTDDVNLFDWTSSVIADRDALHVDIDRFGQEVKDAQTTINALRKELDELIQAKQDHENQLLAKFAELLNQKKLRIRMQQRQLAGQDGPAVGKKGKMKVSRKRKPEAAKEASDAESDSEGFAPMDIDRQEDADASDQESVQAYRSETGSATESEDEDPVHQPVTTSSKPTTRIEQTHDDDLPPVRSLPFGNPPKLTSQSETRARNDSAGLGPDDETASEDDEL